VKLAAISAWITLLILITAGCASQRPVLYPNETLRKQGSARAERAIDKCTQLAKAQGTGPGQGDNVAGSTVSGGAVGAATGATTGAVLGNVGSGAAAGAVGGATSGLIHSLFGAHEPDPVFRDFVNRCLREKGYEPVGWK
jgi:outer membrane lipoprotein SlyB